MSTVGINAAVPVVGGTVLIIGVAAAQFVDRLDVLDAGGPSPVFLRYTSLATYDIKKWPHWIFLSSTTLFAPLIILTSMWQSRLAEDESLASRLQIYGILCAATGYLVSLLPMGTNLGTGVHFLTAGSFVATGFNYCFTSRELSKERGDETLSSTRFVLIIIGIVGCATIILLFGPAVNATEKLDKHARAIEEDNTDGRLEPKEIFRARFIELLLALGQDIFGIAIGLILMTAASEVVDVEETDSETIIAAVVTFLGALVLDGIFYASKNQWYAMCQENRGVFGAEEEADIEKDGDSPEQSEVGSET